MRPVATVLAWTLVMAGASAAELSADTARESAQLAASHLAGSLTIEGAFVYEHDFVSGEDSLDDNIVRQAGAGYALGYYATLSTDAAVTTRLMGALRFYRDKSVAVGDGLMISPDGTTAHANTGATALALLAALYHFEATGEPTFADVREKWAVALRALWRSGGGFRRGPETEDVSPYYDGEAWLAMAEYARLFPDDLSTKLLLAAADRHFPAEYAAHPNAGFNHWGLLAASARYRATGIEWLRNDVARLAEVDLTTLRPEFSETTNSCYLVEGLAAAARALHGSEPHADLYARVVERLQIELGSNLEMQIPSGAQRIDLGSGRAFVDPTLGDWAGAFRNGRYVLKTRIDYTQHCLSALQGYLLWQQEAE